jgi:D-inositol-3-phosphate glycosyltransferase
MRLALLSVHTSPIAKPGGKKVGGMNTYVREIARTFAAQGIDVDIFTRRVSPDEPQIDNSLGDNVRVIAIEAGSVTPLGPTEIHPHVQQFAARVIAFTMRNDVQYDLMFSHYWLSGLVAQSLKESWGIPFIQMFHTLGHMKNRIPSVRTPVPTIRIQSESKVVAWADAIIANTPAEQAQLLWLYNADRRKIFVAPPGVNLDLFAPTSRTDARQQLGIPQGERFMLFVGRIEPLKAVDCILEALHILSRDNDPVMDRLHFRVVGGDPQDKTDQDMMQLQQLCSALGLDNFVSFIPAQNQRSLAVYYSAADVVVMPSEYESFGMVALEAMASGTPVIASEVGGLAYLVREGQTGYLVPARSPKELAGRISDLLSNITHAANMGEQAARIASTYAWPNIGEQVLAVFDEVLQPYQRRRKVS